MKTSYKTLRKGEVKLLDGGTGTELQKRGVSMSSQAWCGPAALENIAVLEDIHRDYIAAGADIITANTYATSRILLDLDGLGDKFEQINRASIHVAQKVRDTCGRPDVLVAGSLSHRGPIAAGTARPDSSAAGGVEEMARAVRELALLLRDEGCDLILLEMMYDPIRMPLVFSAAAKAAFPSGPGFRPGAVRKERFWGLIRERIFPSRTLSQSSMIIRSMRPGSCTRPRTWYPMP
jgi:methionine synthase I (cobalamin-dependent)